MFRRNRQRLLPIIAAALLIGTGSASAIDLPFGLGSGTGQARARIAETPAPVQLAQAGDGGVRISQMEEEMRRLNGKVEELSFLVLQLQEQLRKTQEDNEFRFQDLEQAGGGGAGSAGTPQRRTDAAPAALPSAGEARVASAAPPSLNDAAPATLPARGDEIGDILTEGLATAPASPPTVPSPSSGQVASVSTDGPVELYSLGYNYMLAGDYGLAENTFRQYTQAYPTSQDAPDAQYWLGEALYAQAKYRDAAEVFLNAQKSHPQATKAPEMMLKLGMSLARLDNRETACVTYSEVNKRYPQMSSNVKRKLQVEEKSASCS